MKRQKRLTKRERKALQGPRPNPPQGHHHGHIHCIACGRHLDEEELVSEPPTALMLTCQHGSTFPSCTACRAASQELLDTHDRTGQPVQAAAAHH